MAIDTSRLDECADYANVYKTQLQQLYSLLDNGEKETALEYAVALIHYVLSGNDNLTTDNFLASTMLQAYGETIKRQTARRAKNMAVQELRNKAVELRRELLTQDEIGARLNKTQPYISRLLNEAIRDERCGFTAQEDLEINEAITSRNDISNITNNNNKTNTNNDSSYQRLIDEEADSYEYEQPQF
jgi:hypothetical protein